MKNIILTIFAAFTCLQVNAQVMEVWQTDNPLLGSATTYKIRACKNDDTYKYTFDIYMDADGNNMNSFIFKQTANNSTTTLNSFKCSENLVNDDKYYQVRVYNKTCMWGSVPTKEQAIDLGQTYEINGTTYKVLWAPWNLGANSNEDKGCYFAWGEVGTEWPISNSGIKTPDGGYTTGNYRGPSTATEMDDAHDPAVQWWGNGWQTPTADMLKWLVDNGKWSKDGIFGTNALNYYTFTANSQTLTFYRAGYYDGTSAEDTGSDSNKLFLLSRTKGTSLVVYENWGSTTKKMTTELSYYKGESVRPVMLVAQ